MIPKTDLATHEFDFSACRLNDQTHAGEAIRTAPPHALDEMLSTPAVLVCIGDWLTLLLLA